MSFYCYTEKSLRSFFPSVCLDPHISDYLTFNVYCAGEKSLQENYSMVLVIQIKVSSLLLFAVSSYCHTVCVRKRQRRFLFLALQAML